MMGHRQRGIALIELLIGVVIGLFIVAVAVLATSSQASGYKRQLAEVQVQQDLRAAMDVVVRELRRAGHWEAAHSGMWSEEAAAGSNPFADVSALPNCSSNVATPFPDGASACGVVFSYDRPDATATAKQIGIRHRNGAIEMQFGNGGWQAVTDIGAIKVTSFTLTMHRSVVDRSAFCTSTCPAEQPQCGPKQTVRDLDVTLVARSALDAAVTRSMSANVRLRNDAPSGSCP